ncbi:MAG: helix-turn-helix domain-containing protein [Chloroflexi bacterium]|nr:helix-turn-helix domain-containing protein [Chloroflexota bacterium]
MAIVRDPPRSLRPRELRQALGLSRERMARLLDVSSKTVERMEESDRLPSSAVAAARLAQIEQIVELGLMVYTPEGFEHFIWAPLPTFGGLTALQMIERDQADQVLGALATDYEGAPT